MKQKAFDFNIEQPNFPRRETVHQDLARPAIAVKPELHEIRPPDEGGPIAIHGFEYQHQFTLSKCIQLLSNPSSYQFVSSETHDDVVVKRTEGNYEFYQVKRKAEGAWTVMELHNRQIWLKFLNLRRCFGPNSRFVFVSDQTAKRGRTRTYDLYDMKKVTMLGQRHCNEKDKLVAKALINTLHELLGGNREEIEDLFWSIRILTDSERENGLRSTNLIGLGKALEQRGIKCDSFNLERIYSRMKDLLVRRIIPKEELSYEEVLKERELSYNDLESCIGPPFSTRLIPQFTLSDSDTVSLQEKTIKAGFPANIQRYFLESRNYFSAKYYLSMADSAEYIADLRMKIWRICIERQMRSQTNPAIAQYSDVLADLNDLVTQEKDHAPFELSRELVHGMLCQLTAECHHDWHMPKD